MIALPIVYHALGRKADSDAALAALIAKYGKDAAYNIATVYAFRGEADLAFAWLDKANEYGDPGLSEIATEHFFDNIRADPRWLPFLRKIGYAPEQLAKIEFKVTLPKAVANKLVLRRRPTDSMRPTRHLANSLARRRHHRNCNPPSQPESRRLIG